ncbi:MAG: GFA family protein [Proteobacteria bacterium]|nr:GFA family protein [Pseudomonadota bacterium]
MVAASCHCGAVRFEVEPAPEWVLDCNCSHCRLYGGLWAYYPQRDVKFAAPPDTFIYMWGDRELEFHHCRTCGCATHSTVKGTDDAEKIAVNARLMRGLDPAKVRLVQKNNGNDGVFWTKSDSPPLPSHDLPAET